VFENILPDIREIGIACLSGYGEPFMHPEFLFLMKKLDDNKIVTTFSTNGTLITDYHAKEISKLRYLGNVNISIDSVDAVGYKKLRGGSIEQAIEGAGLLRKYRSRLSVSTILLKSNIDHLIHFPGTLAKIGIKKWVLQSLKSTDAEVNKDNVFYTDEVAGILNSIYEEAKKNSIKLIIYQPERLQADISAGNINAFFSRPEKGMTRNCVMPWLYPFINKDGLVFPCCYLSQSANAIMGDINNESIEDIWNGTNFQEYRKSLMLADDRSLPAPCISCAEAKLTKQHMATGSKPAWYWFLKKFEMHQSLRKIRYRTFQTM